MSFIMYKGNMVMVHEDCIKLYNLKNNEKIDVRMLAEIIQCNSIINELQSELQSDPNDTREGKK